MPKKPTGRQQRELKKLLSTPRAAFPIAPTPCPPREVPTPTQVGELVERELSRLTQLPLTPEGYADFERAWERLEHRSTPPCPPSHRLGTRQWVLLELVKTAMHTSDEGYSSVQDALHNLPSLRQLTDEILKDDTLDH